ncbi:hypothetical protein ACLMJK_004154 [Lecanora helva]
MAAPTQLSIFEDFDDHAVYRRQAQTVLEANDGTFLVQFDNENAISSLNFDETSLDDVINSRPDNATRWINIWGPERHTGLVKRLSAQYEFSPRLLGIMCSGHHKPTPIASTPQHHLRLWTKHSNSSKHTSLASPLSDPEKNIKSIDAATNQDTLDVSHYKVVNEVWHYCSVDWGERCKKADFRVDVLLVLQSKDLCIGYNSLSDPTLAMAARGMDEYQLQSGDEDHVRNKPDGIRTWTWLVLCDDGTVISIYETPFPDVKGSLDEKEKVLLPVIRRNLHNVLRQLSKVNDEERKQIPLNTLDIRPGLSSNLSVGQSSRIKIEDSASLLFYYLFDDWYTTYALVAKREHQYARRLERLRKSMVAKPDVLLIDQLHQYGRELAVLKRMYQSYALIIERILHRQKPVSANAMRLKKGLQAARHPTLSEDTTSQLLDAEVYDENQAFGAPLSAPATVRFERLLDRINLFAISEIQECLDEKESLVFLNFNLLAMKESHAVERLTRVTILLAKVTILFMPVSIMTAYFSTTLIGVSDQYSIRTYWICFAVIMIVTFLLLLMFGQISGTVEGKPIYRTLEQTAYEALKGKWRMRRSKNKRQAA